MDEYQWYWLAGLLEGEGSFMKGTPSQPRMPVISLQMTDEDVVAKAANLLGTRYYLVRPKRNYHKTVFLAKLRGKRAVGIMMKIRPLMGQRRQQQIDKAVACYKPQEGRLTDEQVATIRLRLASGCKQSEVAKEFCVSRVAIHYINKGETHCLASPVG